MLYFAYGSNLDWSQMKSRCPSSQFVAKAKLEKHRLAFTRKSEKRGCGVADIVPSETDDVWGVVYSVDETDIAKLDKYEGFTPGQPLKKNAYVREERHVYVDGDIEKPLLITVYIANKQKNSPLPNSEYKRLIVEGAKYWHLPEDYIEQLDRIETI